MPHTPDAMDQDGHLPKLVRVYIAQSLIGFALGAAFVALLLAFDVAGLRGLIWRSEGGWLALTMLVVANGLVFAGVQFAIRIMRLADADDQDPGPSLRFPLARAPQLVAQRVARVAGPQRP